MIDFSLECNACERSEIDNILQQIDILFDSTPTEVFGEESFGTEYDRYLHQLKISNEGLKQTVLSDLNKINLSGFIPNVDVYLLHGTEDDIAIVDITLKRYDEVYNKAYKIT